MTIERYQFEHRRDVACVVQFFIISIAITFAFIMYIATRCNTGNLNFCDMNRYEILQGYVSEINYIDQSSEIQSCFTSQAVIIYATKKIGTYHSPKNWHVSLVGECEKNMDDIKEKTKKEYPKIILHGKTDVVATLFYPDTVALNLPYKDITQTYAEYNLIIGFCLALLIMFYHLVNYIEYKNPKFSVTVKYNNSEFYYCI